MKFLKSTRTSSLLNMFVLMACVYAANTRCCWLLHQPKLPEDMRQFKRF